jgi:signal transduction histidine kinase
MIPKPGLRVLLVEDNPDHAMLAKNAIVSSKKNQYAVDVCNSVEEAMEKVKQGPVNLIVCDYHLPGKNGLEFLEWLNAEEFDVPFMMMTGMGDEKTAVKAMQLGAYNYVVKDDVYLNVLPHAIDEAFIRYLSEREKEKYEKEIREKNVALEKANRELKKLDQLKSDFIASVSHDFRTPLNSIREGIALVLDGVVDPTVEKGRKMLEIAKRNSERLAHMINDLLDFSKLDAGKMRLHMEPCNLQVLIDEVIGSLSALANKKQIKLKFQPVDDFPKVTCDAERMIQVFTNLIGNSIKFTPEKGTITVQVELVPNNQVKIMVSDTGVGIAKENLERIFERFEQVKNAAPNGEKGTGLGLSICREFMKLHNGTIWAESEPEKGSRFLILMPIEQKAPAQHAAA